MSKKKKQARPHPGQAQQLMYVHVFSTSAVAHQIGIWMPQKLGFSYNTKEMQLEFFYRQETSYVNHLWKFIFHFLFGAYAPNTLVIISGAHVKFLMGRPYKLPQQLFGFPVRFSAAFSQILSVGIFFLSCLQCLLYFNFFVEFSFYFPSPF